MPIKEWIDSRGHRKVYVSKQWPDGSRFRRVQPNKTVAKKTLARLEEAIAMGTWRELKEELTRRKEEEKLVVRDFSATYLNHCRTLNTRVDFKVQAFSSINRILGDVPLEEFSVTDADRFVAVRSEEVSSATINRGLAVLKNMFNFAKRRKYVGSNPLIGYEMLPEQERPLRIMTVEEYRNLVRAVSDRDATIGVFVAVLGETGLRKSEGLRLTWSHIDLPRRQLTVEQSKSRKARYVPLSDFALGSLGSLIRRVDCDSVFIQWPMGVPWKDPRGPFLKGRDACGLTWVRGFHDLRHFRATQWLQHGMNIRQVQELLGHSDITTTSRYLHFIQSDARNAVREAHRREIVSLTGR